MIGVEEGGFAGYGVRRNGGLGLDRMFVIEHMVICGAEEPATDVPSLVAMAAQGELPSLAWWAH